MCVFVCLSTFYSRTTGDEAAFDRYYSATRSCGDLLPSRARTGTVVAGPAHQLAMRMRTVSIALACLNGRLPPVDASEVASRNDY